MAEKGREEAGGERILRNSCLESVEIMFLRIDDRLVLRFGLLFLLWIGSSRQQEEDIPHNE